MKKTVIEWCAHCENEVELIVEFKEQICPACGEKILPCALCRMDEVDCSKCPCE